MVANNFVLGRGRIYLARLDPSTKDPGAFRYVGASREFNLTAETETLEHTSSDRGVNEVDASVPIGVTRSGTMIFEDIVAENLAMFFFGSLQSDARAEDAAAALQTWKLEDAQLKRVLADGYDADAEILIGATASNPVGALNVLEDNLAIAGRNSANPAVAVTLEKGTDWEIVDAMRGSIRLLDTAKTYQAAGDAVLSEITVTYRRGARAGLHDQVVSGGTPFEGALRFVESNPEGGNDLWVIPQMEITPNGDLSLKGDDWRQVPFSIAVQKPANAEAVYINGIPQS